MYVYWFGDIMKYGLKSTATHQHIRNKTCSAIFQKYQTFSRYTQENMNENSGIFIVHVSHLNGELFIAQSE